MREILSEILKVKVMGNFDELYEAIKLARQLCSDVEKVEKLSQGNKEILQVLRGMEDKCIKIMNLTNVVLQAAN